MIRRLFRSPWWPRFVGTLAMSVIVGVGVIVGALAAGYRPVVIQTGSMGDTAPPRSLIIAAPTDAADVATGDIVVMRRPGATPVTHRVIEIESEGSNRFAVTQGDANEAPDPAPYPLEGEQLVSRWILPGWGGHIQTAFQPGLAMAIVALATVVIALQTLRRLWATPVAVMPAMSLAGALPKPQDRTARRRRWLAATAVPLTAVMSTGIAWALFQSADVVASNDFNTAACFDPQLNSVQSGETIHAVNGTVAVALTPVDPTASFVMASIRSAATEPADSVVQAQLTGGGTGLELVRFTDNSVPPPVTVAWSVVEYSCGVTVQRGSVTGDGTGQLDVPIVSVDAGASFVLVSSAPEATSTDFDADDLFIAELSSPTTLTIRTSGAAFSSQRTFAWQVVSFADAGDLRVQTVSGTIGIGAGSATLALPFPADPSSTFLLTNVTSTSTGPDIGERMVRAHLADADTVAISRGVSGDAVEVQVQVITLKDGSNVRHGTIDFAAGQPARTVVIEPVDISRSTAISTVAVPGMTGGGQTDHATDDVLGEASATFALTDAANLSVMREATTSNASFGWQVIEWAGPQWWDPSYTFRQRIDVDTAAVAAPDAYSVPLTIDHAALVTSGLALADGSDIRVLRWNGSAWTELDRVLDDAASWNQVTTTIWFRTVDPIAADATSSYWLYYGNGAPSPAAEDPEAVYLLNEDFETGTLGDFEDRTGGTGWYEAAPWTRRIPLTVAGGTVTADLTDFPMLVSVTNADLGTNAQPDGSDIRFTGADGVKALPHEIESWNPATGALVAWVNVPSLPAASATTIYLYYGAGDAPAQQDVRGTWPPAFVAAWHLQRDPAGDAPQVDDSTIENHDGLSAGAMTPGDLVPGLVGAAVDLDGVDDVLQVDSFDLLGVSAVTMSGWVRLDSYSSGARIITKADDASTRIFELAVTNAGAARARLSLDGVVEELAGGAGTVTLGAWHHVAATWDGTTLRVFVDGAEVANAPASGTVDTNPTMPVTLGNLITANAQVDGLLDEVRIERLARTVAWLQAAEMNQRTPVAFVSVGGVETGTWFGQGSWARRKPIVVESAMVTADVAEFSLLVQVTDPELQATAGANAADIVFTDADGTTRLDHVVESYDNSTGALSAWVLVPTLSSAADTQLLMYYGNPAAADQQDTVGVFGPDADLAFLGGS